MSEVLEGLFQKRASLAAELGALDAGIAAYRRALVPTKSAAVQVNGTRPTMSMAARKKLSLLAKARWAKNAKKKRSNATIVPARRGLQPRFAPRM